MFHLARKVEKFGDVFAEKKVTLSWLVNSNMVKPEKFDRLHLVYHFMLPLEAGFFWSNYSAFDFELFQISALTIPFLCINDIYKLIYKFKYINNDIVTF